MARKKTIATAQEFQAVATRQRILGEPARLRILALLRLASMNVTEICERLAELGMPLAQPTVSHHLTVLLSARFVSYVKVGRVVTYSISVDELAQVAGVEAMTLIERGA